MWSACFTANALPITKVPRIFIANDYENFICHLKDHIIIDYQC